MSKIYVYPYTTGSESARLLADRLDALRIRLENSTYVHKPDNIVVNWGSSSCPHPCLNPSHLLKDTVNKLRFFRKMSELGLRSSLPNYWTDASEIPQSAYPVLCRTKVEGMDGAGIVIANNREELVSAQLYTKLIEGCTEYRVTLFKGYGVTDVQLKKERASAVNPHPFIKTYANGWGFVRVHTFPVELTEFASKILDATGLDFAGLDIVRTPTGHFKVLEVNSAMGLEGQALDNFAKAVEWYVDKRNGDMVIQATQHAEDAEEEPMHIKIQEALDSHNYAEVIRCAAQMI